VTFTLIASITLLPALLGFAGDKLEVTRRRGLIAAGFVAVALVLGEYQKAAGSALQLLVNLTGIVVSAVAVLLFYRLITKRLPRDAARRLRRDARRPRR
jgi:drug/metabolite transporter (DMT)-like permease